MLCASFGNRNLRLLSLHERQDKFKLSKRADTTRLCFAKVISAECAAQPEEAPLINAIQTRGSKQESSFHVPGHKVTLIPCGCVNLSLPVKVEVITENCSGVAERLHDSYNCLEMLRSSTILLSCQVRAWCQPADQLAETVRKTKVLQAWTTWPLRLA